MKKFLSKFSVFHIEILFLLIIGLVPLFWYKAGYIGLGHDMGFPLAPIDHFLDRLYTWTDRLGPFGSNSVQVLPGVFIHGLEALLSVIGLSLLNVQKITFIFWFVLPGITMYTLLRYLHPKQNDYPVRIFGSLFYMMNHYLLQAWVIAERTKFSIVAALPLVVLLIIKTFHKQESPLKNSMLLALTLFFLNGGEGIPLLISSFVVVIATALIFFFLSGESFWSKTKRLLVFSFLSVLFWILLSSYWLYPYFRSYKQTFGQRFEQAWGTAGAVSWSQGIGVNTSWINLFRLRGIPDWYASPDHPYANEFFKNPILLFLNLLLPILALVSFLNLKNSSDPSSKARINFLVLLLIAIPLSAGSHSPLGIFYDYLLVNVPGFGMFRSGFFKFGMIIWFAYAYLIAVGTKDVIDWSKNKLVRAILLGAFIVLLFIYNYPFFTGNFFNYSKGKSTMVKVPGYILEAKKELDSNKFSTRTLSLPNSDVRTEYIEYDWGYFSLNDLSHMMGRKSLTMNGVLARPDETNLIMDTLSEYVKFGKSNLVKFIGADRAVVQNDFISPDYDGNILSGITESFKKSKDFTFKKSVGRWDFYDYNGEILPQIYSPSAVTFISSDQKDLDIVANLPGALDNDAFVWSDYPKDGNKEEIFDKFIIQAKCAECSPTENYQIYFSTSKVLIPGTVFYEFGKYVNEAKKYLAGSANTRFDINLSNSTTLISDLGSLQAKKDEKGIQIAVRDLTKNLKEIKFNLDQIYDPNTKQEFLKKLRFYLSFFLSYESQWATSAQPGPIKSDLSNLETELRKLTSEIEKNIGQIKIEADDKSYKYAIDIPKDGIYDLYLYGQSSSNNEIILMINDHVFSAKRLNQDWYKATKTYLKSPSVIIDTPKFQDSGERPIIFATLNNNVKLTSPNIEFVALNQTKYLIKVRNSDRFILSFNSRFDDSWKLREVDNKIANRYFRGSTKSYLDGKVAEYERGDKHIITDLIFPKSKQGYKPTLGLNGFSSGWVLTPQNQATGERVYLLEYNLQNEFYKSAGVSLFSLLIILCYLYFNRHDKKSI